MDGSFFFNYPLPARMLNEYTYCPRLAFLEWVQGEWAHNPDTLDGAFVHRNTDLEDSKPIEVPSENSASSESSTNEIIHARSVRLENELLGLVAIVDILEVEGPIATPVDYKKGLAPDHIEGAWDPERVQLCAQALLLKNAGFTCNKGIIWYSASKSRVSIEFDDALVSLTMSLIEQCREMAQKGKMPLPLVDSPKCPRCSLVAICLPDETNRLLDQEKDKLTGKSSKTAIRSLLAPASESVPLHVVEPGARVGKRGDRLIVELKSEKLAEIRIKDISQVCLYGPVQITTQAITALFISEIPILYYSTGGWFNGMAQGLPHKNIEVRIRQHAVASDVQEALRLARTFVSGKIRNARTLLRRNLADDPDSILIYLKQAFHDANRANSISSLLGIEGMAAKRYFSGFGRIIQNEKGFQFVSRNRRPPTDPVNATLSFLYAILARELTVNCLACGLDPYLGFLHQPRYGRPALALDLAEEFRPILADSTALSLFNTGELNPNHFVNRAGACVLKPAGKKAVLSAWERRLHSDVTHPIFGYTISWRRILMVQPRLLARVLLGELPNYPPFKTR